MRLFFVYGLKSFFSFSFVCYFGICWLENFFTIFPVFIAKNAFKNYFHFEGKIIVIF